MHSIVFRHFSRLFHLFWLICAAYVSAFRQKQVTGAKLLVMKDKSLQDKFGIADEDDRAAILNAVAFAFLSKLVFAHVLLLPYSILLLLLLRCLYSWC